MYDVKEGCLHIGLIGLEFLETSMTKRTSGAGEATVPPELHMAPGRPLTPVAPDSRSFRSGDLVLGAARIRTEAARRDDHSVGAERRHAEMWEEQARTGLPAAMAEIGVGRELLPEDKGGLSRELRSTVDNPDYVTADASRDRLELAHQAGVLELALDTADTIEAQNSLEMMLAHQLAATHRSALLMTAQMNRQIERMNVIAGGSQEAANVQACRLAGAVSRLTTTFQQGVLTLQRMRSGGRQVVTVQHVHVGEGGRAVVAGEVATGGEVAADQRGQVCRMNDEPHTYACGWGAHLALAHAAPRCGAKRRDGGACQSPA